MPPKKNEPSRKTQEKQKQKVIEDKTFGLKNKKGKKQQQYISHVQNQVKGNASHRQKQMEIQKKKDLENAKAEETEMKSLFKIVIDKPKVDPGTDPKSILCAYFKHGLCKKGDKCPFSHDLQIARKTEKRNLFVDNRNDTETNADWDQEMLESVISSKHTNSTNKNANVCNHFIDAVERGNYGWFWVCPNNGDNCHYRHALPPGYVLKKDRQKVQTNEVEVTIEEVVEKERYDLGENLTPVTEATFQQWKRDRIQSKRTELAASMKKKKDEFIAGKTSSKFTGKEIFTFDPNMAVNDDTECMEGNDDIYQRENVDEDKNVVEVTDDSVSNFSKKAIPDNRATFANNLNPRMREALLFKGREEDESKKEDTHQATTEDAAEEDKPDEDIELDNELLDQIQQLTEQELRELSLTTDSAETKTE